MCVCVCMYVCACVRACVCVIYTKVKIKLPAEVVGSIFNQVYLKKQLWHNEFR